MDIKFSGLGPGLFACPSNTNIQLNHYSFLLEGDNRQLAGIKTKPARS
ncbi:hypothetical protein [Pantoea agglomerans]|jgi:hypothetical protein|nr:hypothetical protein [Pantoea agglomerans]NEG57603.1 hypothetical protein [Pantoea agglomerans]NEG97373.1 hypothetical protein [Pantoea agglomerans]NEH02841.1 hypothetical protein [Pantoea agglomerans]NEH13928.1 hypothetical protein [Pantoea agglomerans]QTC51954.1 hypothetical protein H0Z11_09035 [Pantoea agglomerans]